MTALLNHSERLLLHLTKRKCARRGFALAVDSVDESPLRGIRILDLTRIVAGPFCTMILGDLGAEVIKIERPGTGDESRKWSRPSVWDSKEGCYFISLNRNKKSVCIDLKSIRGQEIVYDFAKNCDVLVENYVPGKLDELKLGYEHLKKVAPQLIYCSITGYGPFGPYRTKPGYDSVASAVGGLLHITGPEDGEPCKVGIATTDMATGLYAQGAILAALLKRSRTRRGQKIDCSLLATQISSLINIASNYLNAGKEAKRWGTAHESIVPYEAFPTKDGYYVVGVTDHHFADFCQRIRRADLLDNENFQSNSQRVVNRQQLIGLLKSEFVKKTNAEWVEIFKDASFPCGPINTIKEAFEDPQVKAMDLVKELEHPIAGTIKVVGPPVLYSEGGNFVRLPPPTLGQHTKEVLQDLLGYDSNRIEKLIADKIIQ